MADFLSWPALRVSLVHSYDPGRRETVTGGREADPRCSGEAAVDPVEHLGRTPERGCADSWQERLLLPQEMRCEPVSVERDRRAAVVPEVLLNPGGRARKPRFQIAGLDSPIGKLVAVGAGYQRAEQSRIEQVLDVGFLARSKVADPDQGLRGQVAVLVEHPEPLLVTSARAVKHGHVQAARVVQAHEGRHL